jgi:FMN phosphatase YigB (HAD superfamily)
MLSGYKLRSRGHENTRSSSSLIVSARSPIINLVSSCSTSVLCFALLVDRNNPVLSFTDSIDSRKDLQQSQVRVVSFDLDDTLWNTSATISAANEALANFLNELKIEQPKRVEKIMGELFQNDKERYCPIQTNKANSPTLLTLLRKDAIELVLKEYNAYTPEDAKEMADKSFDVWMQGRQDTIPLHLADGVVECLRRISSLKTIEGHSVVVGAITDGNCDPRTIPMLKDYFDFCVNAEQVGISKPAKDVYVRAIQEVSRHPSLQSFMADLVNKDDVQVGPWWVHVGDDFVKVTQTSSRVT